MAHPVLERIQRDYQRVRQNPRMLKTVIKELFLIFRKPLGIVIVAGIVLAILIPIATYLFYIRDITSKEKILARKSEGVILLDRNDKPFFRFYEAREIQPVSLSVIPRYTQQAIISIEDKDFYNHPGFDVDSIGRALLTNIEEESFSQGASTLTQQLVKNTLLSQEKTILRKYQELVLALELERRYSKDDILEMYLNTAYFGEGAIGIQNAAQAYFSKDAADLTLSESALLAGILPAPSAYSPLTGNSDIAFNRQQLVLNLMREQGYITEEQQQTAENTEIVFDPKPEELNTQAAHFALMVKEELIKEYGEQEIVRSGFRVKTTIDLEQQTLAEQAVENQVNRLSGNDVTNGAAVALDPKNGEILALVGSHDWFDEENGKINMALRSRQPGSSFKPIVYAQGLDEHVITPATMLDDKPITYSDGYKPRNYDNRFRNEIIARYALANSLNIPAIHVLERTGITDSIERAEKMGITTLTNPSDYGLSFVLGAAEVPLLEMTQAFGVFANHGELVKATTIIDIKDRDGKVIYTHNPEGEQALDEGVAFQIASILSDNQARQDTFGNALTLSRTAAVKTGTTEDYKDALTIGFTPSLVVGVWVGNNDNTPMDSIAGSLGAAPIWRQIMENILRGTPVETFQPPTSIRRVSVCKENGFRAETATSSAYPEFFLPGTVPTKSCNEAPDPTPSVTETPTPTPTNQPENNGENNGNGNNGNSNEPTPTNTPEPTQIIIQIP